MVFTEFNFCGYDVSFSPLLCFFAPISIGLFMMPLLTSSNKELSCLPENVLYEILSFLSIKERCIAGRVCKRWRQIIASKSLWRHVDLMEYKLTEIDMMIIQRLYFTSSLQSLRISGYAHSDFTEPPLCYPFLKKLQSKCPRIHTLQLHDCDMSRLSMSLAFFPSSLTTLCVTCSLLQPHWLKRGEIHLPNLTFLDLSWSVPIANDDLKDIAQFTQLRSLSLRGCKTLDESGIFDIAKGLTLLEKLNLNSTGVDWQGISHVSRHCKNLKELHLQGCNQMSDLWLSYISSGLSNLQVLVLDVLPCGGLSHKGMKELWTMNSLKQLTFSAGKFTEDELELVKRGFIQKVDLKC